VGTACNHSGGRKDPCGYIAVNKVIPQTDYDLCTTKRVEQQGYIERIHSRYPDLTAVTEPLFPRQFRRISDLNEIGEVLLFDDGSLR